jgi:hypothetical protein
MISKQTLFAILTEANQRRLSKEVQDEMNRYNLSRWFATVTDAMHIRILAEFGFGDFLGTALDELYSARWRYRDDAELTTFFSTLVHVRMDFTGQGHIKVGDQVPDDAPLATLDGEKKVLREYFSSMKPLIVFAGSYT